MTTNGNPGSNVLVIHVVQSRWFFLSRAASSRSDDLRVRLHLLVKDSQRLPDYPFDEHADQNTFDRPIGKRAIDLESVSGIYPYLLISLYSSIKSQSL